MQGLPHDYSASAEASPDSLVTTRVEGKADLTVAPPSNFGGSGTEQSPEDLQAAMMKGMMEAAGMGGGMPTGP